MIICFYAWLVDGYDSTTEKVFIAKASSSAYGRVLLAKSSAVAGCETVLSSNKTCTH